MKLIAIDLDGTLLNSNNKISDEDITMINKSIDLGINIVIATGRTFDSASEILKIHNLKVPYIITCNGAIITDYDGTIISSSPLAKTSMEKVISFLYYNNYYFNLVTKNTRLCLNNSKNLLMSDFYLSKGKKPYLKEKELDNLIDLFYTQLNSSHTYIESFPDLLATKEDIFGICAISFNEDKLKFGLQALKDINNLSIFKSASNNFELINKNSSKGLALEFIAKRLNISLEQTMSIGDNENDISMLKAASFSVAMGNAKDEIKNIATFVTLDNNSSGVSHAIENMLIIRV